MGKPFLTCFIQKPNHKKNLASWSQTHPNIVTSSAYNVQTLYKLKHEFKQTPYRNLNKEKPTRQAENTVLRLTAGEEFVVYSCEMNRRNGYVSMPSVTLSILITSSSQTKNKDPIDLPNTIGTYSSPKCSRIKLEITKGIEEGLQNIKVLTVR